MCHHFQTDKCCCGCIDTYRGLFIWVLMDVIFNITAFVLYCILIGLGPQVSIVFVTMADTLLVIGVYLQNTSLILAWLVAMTIYIVFLFTLWVALPIVVRNNHLYSRCILIWFLSGIWCSGSTEIPNCHCSRVYLTSRRKEFHFTETLHYRIPRRL